MPTIHKTTRPWMPVKPKSTARWSNEAKGGMSVNFYRQAAWRTLRLEKLRQNPLCEECHANNRLVEAKVVDHVKPIRLGGEPLEMANLMSLCQRCHARKSGRERHVAETDGQ